MNTPTSPMITTPSSSTPGSQLLFDPLDFLQQFVSGFNSGMVFRTANDLTIQSTIREGDIITPAQIREAFDIIVGYFKPPGLSAEMDVSRIQQYAVFFAEIVKHQHRHGREASSRFTAYEIGNAVAALQKALKPQTPTGKN